MGFTAKFIHVHLLSASDGIQTMIMFGRTQPNGAENNWRRQLDEFVKANQEELAALAWGLFLEKGEEIDTVGIDLKPAPHFVYCPREAIETLNRQVDNHLQEILGLVDNHKPEKEVLMIGIGSDQIKLIYFEPEPAPPACFERVAKDVDTLVQHLEQRMKEQIQC